MFTENILSCNKYVTFSDSLIHNQGIFAITNIPNETRIIEYVGEKIDKKESLLRSDKQRLKADENNDAAVLIFTLDEEWDIDGGFDWNPARLINHSCTPNSEAWIEGDQIFIYALRVIEVGEEITFNYGFEAETYLDHPCQCGEELCVGYIVAEAEWPKLFDLIEESSTPV